MVDSKLTKVLIHPCFHDATVYVTTIEGHTLKQCKGRIYGAGLFDESILNIEVYMKYDSYNITREGVRDILHDHGFDIECDDIQVYRIRKSQDVLDDAGSISDLMI